MISAICFPDKPENQNFFLYGIQSFLVSLIVMLGFLKPSRLFPEKFTAFALNASDFPRDLDDLVKSDKGGRKWATRILQASLSFHSHLPREETGLIKVYDFLMACYGKECPGETTLDKHWQKHKCISHFLLAYQIYDKDISKLMITLGGLPKESFREEFRLTPDLKLSEKILADFNEAAREAATLKTEDISPEKAETSIKQTFGAKGARIYRALGRLMPTKIMIMATARQIARDASGFFAHGQEKLGRPLLDPKLIWTFPASLELPEVCVHYPTPNELRKRIVSKR